MLQSTFYVPTRRNESSATYSALHDIQAEGPFCGLGIIKLTFDTQYHNTIK